MSPRASTQKRVRKRPSLRSRFAPSPTPPSVILRPAAGGPKNPIAPEVLALSSPFSPRPPTPPPTPRELLTTAEAAELLRVDPQTLSTWRVTGHHHDLPFVKMGSGGTGGRVYYRRSDLEAFITRHLFRNTAQADVIPAPWRHSRPGSRSGASSSGNPAFLRHSRASGNPGIFASALSLTPAPQPTRR